MTPDFKPGDVVFVQRGVGCSLVATLSRVPGGQPDGWVLDTHWPGWPPTARYAKTNWVRRLATPEEIARHQLDQLGAEDAL